jgi:2-(1,2-epoxy-1,2-dihydrophenyl)acetyl-CoA isomerase
MAETVRTEREGQITKVIFNRPEAFNAFDLDMMRNFADCLLSIAENEDVRGIVITGEGRAFSAGGDLKWVTRHPQGPAAAFHELASRFHSAVLEIRHMKKPVIAAVNGVAAGGGFSAALACDFRVMARSAVLRQVYTSNGLCIDGGGTFFLTRLVGLARALEIVAFDKPISAEQALSWGLANRVVADGHALEEAVGMAKMLAAGSMNAFGWVKRLLTDSMDTSLETQLERERDGICRCAEHPDGREGLRAFSEKRPPMFR